MKRPSFHLPADISIALSHADASHSSLITKRRSRSCTHFSLGLNLMPLRAKRKQPSASNFQSILDCKGCLLRMLQCSKAQWRGWAGRGNIAAGGSTPAPVFTPAPDYITAEEQQKGPLSWKRSPGEKFHLPSNPFLLAKLRQKHSWINPWRPDSVQTFGWLWSGTALQILGISKHKITSLSLLFGFHRWKQYLKCQKIRAKIDNRNV